MIIQTKHNGRIEDRGTFFPETKTFRRDNVPLVFEAFVMHETDVIRQLEKLECKNVDLYDFRYKNKKKEEITINAEVHISFEDFMAQSETKYMGQDGDKREQYAFYVKPYLQAMGKI